MPHEEEQSPKLDRKVYRMHLALVRRVNDTHIFAAQAIQVLHDAKTGQLSTGRRDGKDKRYDVPSIKKANFARRKPHEVKQIYSRFLDRELYENFIVAAVSQLESFLFETLRLILTAYPHKLKINVKGLEIERTVSLDALLGKQNLSEVLAELVESRIVAISYANPRTYLQFIGQLAQIDVEDEAFEAYLEIKATRDLLIHNSGVSNATYRAKSGQQARAELGECVPINQAYFDHCVATIKRISGIVSRDVASAFPTQKSAVAGETPASTREDHEKSERSDEAVPPAIR